MITIYNARLLSDLKTLEVDYQYTGDTAILGHYLYVGDCYLSSQRVDLTPFVITDTPGNPAVVSISVPIEDLLASVGNCNYSKEIYDGIFTISIEGEKVGEPITVEKAIINAYTLSVGIANMTLAMDAHDEANETYLAYLLLESAITYITAGMIEKALEAYASSYAMIESKPKEFLDVDINECGQGLGCWIVGGTYVKL